MDVTEPVESGTSDAEGWCGPEEGDSSSGGGGVGGGGGGGGGGVGGGGGGGGGCGPGGETTATPGPTPPGGTPPDPENTSHLLQALSSESHLQGIMRSFEPLPCPICQRTYSSPGNLKQHLENIHMSSNELNFECRICGNKFKSKWYLHKHLHRAHHIRGRKET
ncbi:abrupt-like 8 [Homarus americanus]|uniref:Abrupt-like 8 n=1 Tax=Homarus americanus TaxID=6706 RepID=A0A8J5N0H6_HOMAM|nr:abrupt-like 8 [Homarus americanus]